MSNPKCGQELHKDRMAEVGKCSGDLMICYNFNPRAKDKRRRDIYRCEKHAFHIMSFDHMKHVKFVYANLNEKPKIIKTGKLISNFLTELENKGETKMKCYWKVENGFITGTLCLEANTAGDHEILDGLKNRFEEQVHNQTLDTSKTVYEKPKVRRDRPRKSQVEDKPKKKRGRPKGSKNKPKAEIPIKRKRGRPRKDGR